MTDVLWNARPMKQVSDHEWRHEGEAFCCHVVTADGCNFSATVTLGAFRWSAQAKSAQAAVAAAAAKAGAWVDDFAKTSIWLRKLANPPPMPAQRGPYTMSFHGGKLPPER